MEDIPSRHLQDFFPEEGNPDKLSSAFDPLDDHVYISDPDSHEIIFANLSIRRHFGDVVGRKCYEALQGLDTPCSFCTNPIIFNNPDGSSHTWEFRNKKNNRIYRCQDKAIPWTDGRMVRFERAVEISTPTASPRPVHHEHLLGLLEQNRTGFFQVDGGGTLLFVNTALARLLGHPSPEEFMTKNAAVPFTRTDGHRALVAAARNDAQVAGFQASILHRNGHAIEVMIHASFTGDTLSAMVEDIRPADAAGESLRRSEAKYRALYDDAPDMYHTLDENGIITDCNNTEARVLGYDKSSIIGSPIARFFTAESRRGFTRDFPRLKRKPLKITVEREMVRQDGSTFPVSMHISSEFNDKGEFLRTIAIARDISELKQAEDDLRRSEHQFRAIAETAIDAIIYINGKGEIIYWNPAAEKMFGYSARELAGADLHLLLAPEKYHQAYHRGFAHFKKTGQGHAVGKTLELEARRKDGSIFPIEVSFSVIPTENRYHAVGVIRDISDRVNAERTIRESEKKYRTLFTDSRDAIYMISRDGVFLDVNQATEKLFGYSRSELIGMKVLSLYVDPGQRAKLQAEIESAGSIRDFELRLLHRSGHEITCLATASLWLDSEGKIRGYHGILRDITEKRRTESELIKAQKLEAIGILAGGIAHDFNNLLTGILGNISLLKLKAQDNKYIHERLEQTERAGLQARNLTQQLLTFSKGGEPVKRTAPIKELLVEASRFALRGSNVRCLFDFAEDLRQVHGDTGQLGQVIQNLTLNSDQAMPTGGTLTITARNTTVPGGDNLQLPPGNYVTILFADTGCGIKEELLEKIFDPYFTTKPQGNGLGLAISYSIIRKHGGLLSVSSSPGKGTTFTIILPASEKKNGAAPSSAEISGPPSGQGRILLMDDEPLIRRIAGEMLRTSGYEVTLANDGTVATDLYLEAMEAGTPFDAVILDLTIPGGMGGRETLSCLRGIDPEVKAVVSSGYSNDPIMSDYKKHGFCAVIPKPYSIKQLAKTLHEIMTKPEGRGKRKTGDGRRET